MIAKSAGMADATDLEVLAERVVRRRSIAEQQRHVLASGGAGCVPPARAHRC